MSQQLMERQCVVCGRWFVPSKVSVVCCSDACKASRKKHQQRTYMRDLRGGHFSLATQVLSLRMEFLEAMNKLNERIAVLEKACGIEMPESNKDEETEDGCLS